MTRIILSASNVKNVLFLLTHGQRGEVFNASLTDIGLAQANNLASVLKDEFDKRDRWPEEIWFGVGKRWEQMCDVVWNFLVPHPEKMPPQSFLGDPSISISGGAQRLTGSGITSGSISYNMGIQNLPRDVFDAWHFLRIPGYYSVIICSTPFMESLGLEGSHSGRLYRADVKNEKVELIFCYETNTPNIKHA